MARLLLPPNLTDCRGRAACHDHRLPAAPYPIGRGDVTMMEDVNILSSVCDV